MRRRLRLSPASPEPRRRWYVGPTTHGEHCHEWTLYAFDTRERVKAGRRPREWTAIAQSELEVVREMARCLRLIREGRVPE